jgi:hypothetical protein
MIAIKVQRVRSVLVSLAVISVMIGTWAWARSAASVPLAATAILRVDTSRPGNMFDLGAVGLSTEAWELDSDHLSAYHYRLARLMRLLGPSVLRIGGNSVDFSWWTSSGESPPGWATNVVTPADLEVLHQLLSTTGWRVLLGVDLGHFEPARVADEARYAQEILGNELLGIEIGNEPDDFGRLPKLRPPTYSIGEYLPEAQAYRQALSATGVSVYGPALGKTEWLTQMGTAAGMFTELTQHYYPTSTCEGTEPAAVASQATAAELLSPDVRQQEDETIQMLVRAGSIAARPIRIGETNAVACVTSPAAGPLFASALWALDWALRAASGGVGGINFHGGFGVCGPHSEGPICASDEQAAHAGDVAAQPEYYGLLAARQLEGGRFVPTSVTASHPLPNLTTWATLTPGGTVKIAIDNLATEGLAQPVSIPASGYTVTADTLSGPSAVASADISLGGALVTDDGQWHPRSRPLSVRRSVRVVVPSASAVILTMHPSGSHDRGAR